MFEDKDDCDFWSTSAFRTVKSYVKLFWQESVSEKTLAEQLADTVVGKATAADGKHVAITFFSQLSGEPITCPHLRVCALNDDFLKKLVRAALKARSGLAPDQMDNMSSLQSGDLFIMTDGGIAGTPRSSYHMPMSSCKH